MMKLMDKVSQPFRVVATALGFGAALIWMLTGR